MKHIALLFFMLVMAAHAEEATETSGKLMNVADFVGNKWASVCAYGTYPNQSGVCISDNYQSPQCPTIEFNGTVYGTHAINANVSSFSYHAASGNCYGPYHEYTYNPEIIRPVESGGDFLYAASFSGALCPYGEYHLNGTCYPLNETSQFGCDAGSHMTVTSDASFMGPKKEKPRCNGDYDLYNFVSGTNSPSYLDSRIYPLYNGTLLVWGGCSVCCQRYDKNTLYCQSR